MMRESQNYIPALKYNWLTKVYDAVLRLTMPEQKFKAALVKQMAIRAGDRVLDFGCGSVTLSIIAAKAHMQSEFFAVDIDKEILSIAEKKLTEKSLPIHVQYYDGTRLPYPDNYFDRVMSSLVFHHLTLRQKYSALNEIFRVLKPSGEIHIADFGIPSSAFQRIGFYGVQLLDGFETTNDSLKNALSKAMWETNFSEVEEKGFFKTLVGTVRLTKGIKLNKSTS